MIKVIGERGSGKTTKLVKLSAEKQIPILCMSEASKKAIFEKAKNLGISNLPTPVVFEKDYRGFYEVLVDDAEFILKCLLKESGLEMKGFSISRKDLGEELYEL